MGLSCSCKGSDETVFRREEGAQELCEVGVSGLTADRSGLVIVDIHVGKGFIFLWIIDGVLKSLQLWSLGN